VHSFAPTDVEDDSRLGTAEYGEQFVCAVEHGTLFGVQFHPEKSSVHGLRLLENFAAVCASVGAPS
jgi:glutamine amidotransferase